MPRAASPGHAGLDLGYHFEPACADDDPCHRRLTVWLRAAPTERHFDPQSVLCQVVSGRGGCDPLNVQHPWLFADSYRLYPGRITLKDRVEKEVSAFTFGGELEIEAGGDVTVCLIRSSAPLLHLLQPESGVSAFAAEVEVVLAKRRALWERRGALPQFEERLAAIDPQALYFICLAGVEVDLQPLAGDSVARQALRFINRQQQELSEAGKWPLHVAAVDEAL